MTPGADSNFRVPMAPVTFVLTSLHLDALSREQIDGTLARDRQSAESIFLDGGCMHGPVANLESYGNRIRWVSQLGQTLLDAVNGGWVMTRAEWLGSVDCQEDLWPHTIPRLMPAALSRGKGVFIGANQVRREIIEPSVRGGARGWA